MKKLVPLICTALLSACGISEAEVDVSSAETDVVTEELGTVVYSYVTTRRDYRRCMAPLCGGYWVHDLNRVNLNEQYVSALDFSQSGLDDASQQMATSGGDGEVILRGRLGPQEPQFKTRKFMVLEAWRGMPGVSAAAGELVYRVSPLDIQCFAAPCATLSLRKVNYALTKQAHGLMTHRAALSPLVDQAWMSARVERHDALIAAAIITGRSYGAGQEKIASASQVFIKLPNRNGPCPLMRLAMCPSGEVHSYSRSDELCLMPAGCVVPGMCAQYIPQCPDGYSLATWSGGAAACPVHACDPAFLNPPQE
jgi:hypothetical protein